MAEVTTTQTFSDGDTVTAAKLNNIVANASVGAEIITNRSELTTIDGAADFVLGYDASATDLRKIKPNNLLDTGSVTTTKIADSAVTTAKINDSAITTGKIAAGAVQTSDIADSAVTTAKINDSGVTTAKIADGAVTSDKLSNPQYTGFRNRIYNGDFSIAQRATSFVSGANNDDTYNLDRWYVLSDGNDVVDITQETSTVPTNGLYAIALDVETANKKFGIAQIIEQKNCVGLIGGNVILSFKAKVSATTKLDNVKAAVVAWSGTADTVTSDIISAWGAEGTNPTLIANATYENTPANLSVTTSYATYSLTANVDTANTKNIIVFIWSDVTDTTAGDFLYITDVQLEAGSTATEFERRPYGTELDLCKRYYYELPSGATNAFVLAGGMQTSSNALCPVYHSIEMRASPTLGVSGVAADYYVIVNSTTVSCTSLPSITGMSSRSGTALTFPAGASVGYASWGAAANATAKLTFSSEL